MSRTRFYALAAAALVAIGAGSLAFRKLLEGLPPIHTLEEYTPSLTTRVHDAKATVIAELSIEKRALLPLSKIPVDLQNAVIAVEDASALDAARLTAIRGGRLVGISAGAALHAAIEVASRPEMRGARIVVIVPDGGERYISLPFFAR